MEIEFPTAKIQLVHWDPHPHSNSLANSEVICMLARVFLTRRQRLKITDKIIGMEINIRFLFPCM